MDNIISESIPNNTGLYAEFFTFKECPQFDKLNHDTKELKNDMKEIKQMLEEIYWAPGMPGYLKSQESFQNNKRMRN